MWLALVTSTQFSPAAGRARGKALTAFSQVVRDRSSNSTRPGGRPRRSKHLAGSLGLGELTGIGGGPAREHQPRLGVGISQHGEGHHPVAVAVERHTPAVAEHVRDRAAQYHHVIAPPR